MATVPRIKKKIRHLTFVITPVVRPVISVAASLMQISLRSG
jgi:hypothetical protein